mmetsp:Transcript_118869/g.233480  ORF Transcript_118869/g.233480 Transcript_118869/m.233480 type:complete len:225 (-) Transcript_118869:735-1409(-)
MPASRAAISSARVLMAPSISSMAVSESLIDCSSCLRLSSDWSNCVLQYCCFWSSSFCSAFKFSTISSIMASTLPKPPFLPLSAKAIRSSSGRRDDSLRRSASARERCEALVTCTCTKLALALGNVFLKISRASSSFRTLMVSASASNSSARVFLISSHSWVFVAHPCSSSCLNFLSASKACFVSSTSLLISADCTPSSPIRVILSSICACRVATSFFFAAMRPS